MLDADGLEGEDAQGMTDDLAPGEMAAAQFQVTVPENAKETRPYWRRQQSGNGNGVRHSG